MEEFAALLTNYAFPVVVSMYLLTRLERRIGDLERTIDNLDASINTLTKSVDGVSEEVRRSA